MAKGLKFTVNLCMKIFFTGLFFLWIIAAHAAVDNRTVLALWSSEQDRSGTDYANSYIHQRLEVIFNYYGLKLVFHDLSLGLPKLKSDSYKGIVTWFSQEGLRDSLSYGKWLSGEMNKGKKVLILGEIGFISEKPGQAQDISVVNYLLKKLGIEVSGNFYDNPLLFSVVKNKGPEFVEFERSLENEIFGFRHVVNTHPNNEVWLSILSKGQKKPSDVVIIGENGGFVQEGFVVFTHPQDNRTNWRVNPFKIVEKIFVDQDLPVPDVTTINGKRAFFSHIDGDGFMGVSEVDRQGTCADVILNQVIKKYPYPITASFITGEMENPKAQELARKILSLPHVEAASHTLSHPLSWMRNPSALEVRNYLGEKSQHKGPILSYPKKNPTLDYKIETSGSINYVTQNLAPQGKRAEVIFWSGSCRPPEEALKPLSHEGFLNMNGGDSRMDELYKTYSHLSGLYRQQGPYLHVYSPNANENIYTDLWSPPYSGFKEVIKTFEKTESPLRIKPVNVYFHYYSGQFFSSVKSLQDIYTWVGKQDLIPVHATDYIRSVLGFHGLQIEKKSFQEFVIKDHGNLKTLRLNQKNLLPDYRDSKNVIGHQVFQNKLYVFLGPEKNAYLKLTSKLSDSPFLVSSNGTLQEVARDKKAVTYKFHSHLPLKAKFSVKGSLKDFQGPSGISSIRVEL